MFVNAVHDLPQHTPVADLAAGSGHQSPGLWRHPSDKSWKFKDTEHWVELAKLLDQAKFHGIFIADVLGEVNVQHSTVNVETLASSNQIRWLRCLFQVS